MLTFHSQERKNDTSSKILEAIQSEKRRKTTLAILGACCELLFKRLLLRAGRSSISGNGSTSEI